MKLARLHTLGIVVFGIALAGVAVTACVGDEAPINNTEFDSGTGTPDSSTQTDGSVPIDSGTAQDSGGNVDDSGSGGSCDGGMICGTACIVTTSDSANCGRCSHACGTNSMCKSSVCTPQLLDGLGDGGGAPVIALTSDALEDNPAGAATHVFWSSSGTGGGFFQDNITGGNSIQLGTIQTKSIAVHGNIVYGIGANPGGAPQPIVYATVGNASSQASLGTFNANLLNAITYDVGDNLIVGTYIPTANQYGFFKCTTTPPATCTGEGTFNGIANANIANNGTMAFVADSDSSVIVVATLPGSNTSSTPLTTGGPTQVRVNGTFLYFFDADTSTLQRSSLSVTALKQIASSVNADAIAVDATNIYWTDHTTGTVNFAPQAGTGSPAAYVTLGATTNPMKMVRDTQNLYFSWGAAIYRVALP